MAIPVIAGIPWLAGVIGAFFASLVTWVAQFVTRRLAIVAAALIILASVTAVFFAAVEGIINGLSAVAPPMLSTVLGFVMPSNFSGIVSAILSAHTLRWVYEWNVKVVQLKLF